MSVSFTAAIFSGIGTIIVGSQYWVLPNMMPWVWTYLGLQVVDLLVAWLYLPESPFWLYKNNRMTEFWTVISRVAATNRVKIDID